VVGEISRKNSTRTDAWAEKVAQIAAKLPKTAKATKAAAAKRLTSGRKVSPPSSLEAAALLHIKLAGLPEPEREVELVEGRKYRYDLVWRAERIAVEVNGQIWKIGGHSSGSGLERDYEKIALAQIAGYRIFCVSGRMIDDGTLVAWLKLAFYG